MRKLITLAMLLALSSPLWAARKITVQELKEILVAANQTKKTDEEVATRLKEVELGEELDRATKESLASYIPGPLSEEQMNVLEGRSAFLAPASSELPTTPAPDAAAQKAIVAKAFDYATKIYSENPQLEAAKSTSRYQDGVESIRTNSGVTNNMANTGNSWDLPNKFMRFIGSHSDRIVTNKGVEQVPVVKTKIPWGINGQVSEGGPGLALGLIVQEAADGGKVDWLRWQTIGGKQFAVFSFAVDKKKSRYVVNYCCFPITSDTGRMGYEGTGANFQTGTDWKEFKETVPYRGELFIEPNTGIIVRLITQAGLKPTDFVHQEDIRIDYAPVPVDGKLLMLPVDSFTLTEVVPNGDNYAARYSVRHTLFSSVYQDYRPATSVSAMH